MRCKHLAVATGVNFGATPAAVQLATNSQITVISPAHAPGVVDARVTTAAGTSPVAAADQYEYKASGSADTSPPDTEITKHPKAKVKTRKAKVKVAFEFSSTESGSSFECKLDKQDFTPCESPTTYKLKPGKHTFAVEAIDAAGNRDPLAATFDVKVKRKKS